MHDADQSSEPAPDWEQLRPLLDDLVGELADGDREAVLLRYFENRPLAEVGARLRLSEEGARSRVDRAVVKLRILLERRGVKSSGAALGLALGQQAAGAAPAGLAASVTGAALSGVAAGAGATGLGLLGFMTTTKFAMTIGAVAVMTSLGTAYLGANAVREARTTLTGSVATEQALTTKLASLETRMNAETRRRQTADENYLRLAGTARQLLAQNVAPPIEAGEPITQEVVDRRFKRAVELVRDGDPAEALRELLWCYDVGMPRIAGMGAVRMTLLRFFGELGTRHPPALDVLRQRREKAREVMTANPQEENAAREFAVINSVLQDDQGNVALLRQLPAGDPRRSALAAASFQFLVENRHYREALEGRSYASLLSSFEMGVGRAPSANASAADPFVQAQRRALIHSTAKHIETLAGAGDLDHARSLARRLLAYDSSADTQALLQKHAERAGQAALLAAPNQR
jgi:hypothetical protein